ncbi:MAG: CotH kinase family protein [Candidatus Delongbacteria bacterium]|nr:CotH kinase family protein [Candidatus Delongbacteria bacterium]
MKNFLSIALLLILGVLPAVCRAGFYDINTINSIELIFVEDNWDEILDMLCAAGDEERLIGRAIINGVEYDSVGVRYKGNSSYSPERMKNPFNIKLDHVIEGQEIEGYGTLKLSNLFMDPSFLREALTYEIARQYLPASRANYANVSVNGNLYGLFSNVQAVDGAFLDEHFHSDDNPFFKGEFEPGPPQPGCPNVPPGVWQYLGLDSTCYMSFYELRSDQGWSELIGFLDILNNVTEEIDRVLNLDGHLWMLAFDNLLVNLDSPINISHNFYLYRNSAQLFNPIIWDLNQNIGSFPHLGGPQGQPLNLEQMQQLDPFLNLYAYDYPLISAILADPTRNRMYIAHMRTILEENIANGSFLTRALEIQSIIDADVQADPYKFYTYNDFIANLESGVAGVVGLTELLEGRVDFLLNQEAFQGDQPLIEQVTTLPEVPVPYTQLWITAQVTAAETVHLHYRNSPTEAFTVTPMFDDGQHNDGAGNDGVFGAVIQVGATTCHFYLYAENSDLGRFSPERAATEYYSIAVVGDVVINEFLALNDSCYADQDGEYDDWLELYNNSDSAINLTGYYLSDDDSDPTQWSFPDTSIAPGGFLLIWADEDPEQEGLHTNFKLSGSGEMIIFLSPQEEVMDEVVFGVQVIDISEGRFPDGTGDFIQMTPTPGATNLNGVEATLATNLQPNRFTLLQNYPNPFNPATTISWQLAAPAWISLTLFNTLGEQVAILASGYYTAGQHFAVWDGGNTSENNLSSGIYFYTLRVGESSESRKMLLVR